MVRPPLLLVLVAAVVCVVGIPRGTYDADNDRDFVYGGIHSPAAAKRTIGVDTPTFVPLGSKQEAEGNLFRAYGYIFNALKKTQATMIEYPYSFSTKENVSSPLYEDGAFISTKPLLGAGGFAYLTQTTTIDLAKAKAIYDSSIAILSVTASFDGAVRDLTYEGPRYCSALHDYIDGKWRNCFTGPEYENALVDDPNFESTSVVYVSAADLKRGILFVNGVRRFGTLVIPDIYAGSQGTIASELGDDGKLAVQKFVNSGGLLYAAAKGALVAGEIGVIPGTTFDQTSSLGVRGTRAFVSGCSVSGGGAKDEANWIARSLCFSPPRDANKDVFVTLFNTPIVTANGALKPVAHFKPHPSADYTRTSVATGATTTVSAADNVFPFILAGQRGSGYVVLALANPTGDSRSYPWFYNGLFLANAKPLIIDTAVTGGYDVFPAYEQLSLTVSIMERNLYDFDLTSFRSVVWLAKGTTLMTKPAACTLVNQSVLPVGQRLVPPNALLGDSYVECKPSGNSLAAFAEIDSSLDVFIEDVSITQSQIGIVIAYPQVWYTDTSRSTPLEVELDFGPITINTYQAPLLRAELNPDPAGLYPIPGTGAYIDNVLHTENKESTQALDVRYVSVVPLISALVDGNNERRVSNELVFDWQYYTQAANGVAEYKYPFASPKAPFGPGQTRDEDFLDWRLLAARGNYMVGDWDTPVKNFKIPRNSTFPSGLPDVTSLATDVANSQLTTTVDSDQKVVVESFFPDADYFFELATPRLLAFFDTASSKKAAASYDVPNSWPKSGGVMPAWRKAVTDTPRMKSDLMLVHVDVYFYNATQKYPLPDGVTSESVIFTADEYDDRKIPGACVNELGDQYSEIVQQGYFGNEYAAEGTNHYPRGLRPSEYNNGMLTLCDRRANAITWDDAEAKTGGKVKKTSYYIPLTDNAEINDPEDIMYFVSDPSAPGEFYYSPGTLEETRMGVYENVRSLWLYHGFIPVPPAATRKGGRITVSFQGGAGWPAGFDAVSRDSITVQPDQVALLGTKMDSPSQFSFTFKRGSMPNEGWGKVSQFGVNMARMSSTSPTITASITIEDMVYDLSIPAPHERFVAGSTFTTTFKRTVGLQLPALRMEYSLNRGVFKNDSTLQPYESLEPFVRYGTYTQELRRHATVWADPEVHLNIPANGQGVVARGGNVVWATNMGINPIPFAEYMSTGQKQLIPSSVENSRVEWSDIWGRRFAQPIRTTFPDNAPLPGPLRNFMMTTTVQMLEQEGKGRRLVWQSDEPMMVHAQAKLLNNYVRWFDLTTCKANVVFGNGTGTVFDADVASVAVPNDKQYVRMGHRASYGICLRDPVARLEGTELTAQQRTQIESASLCISGSDWHENCPHLSGLPTVGRRASGQPKAGVDWQYMEQLNKHYPEGYILPSMWDMTMRDHEDSPFVKGHPWHYDNTLPGLDAGNDKPQNIIAFPLYKGLAYELEYSKELSHPKFPGMRGWWSDNLQNRDDTLLAGQAKSNWVSVGQPDSTAAVGWNSAQDLSPSAVNRLKNMYACEFNRHRIKVHPDADIQTFPVNVYVNNVVPIDPTLDKNDPRLSSYVCDLSKPAYSPKNISQFDNYLHTETSSDWLYFGANLRGEGLETLNVLTLLKPSQRERVYKEGMTKINEGGRFVYWNPALGPNTFLVVDDLVSVVMARRTDILVTHDAKPSETSTFNSSILHIIKMEDEAEINRTWDSPIYINHHGFGDSSVAVYVGGYDNTGAVLQPGSMTYVEVVFYNNAGFDWNLKASAINATEIAQRPISGNDLLYKLKHSIQVPNAYNFMTPRFEEPELAKYVRIVPSDHNIDTAPLYFDFENINVASIRDGYKGRYFYKLFVDASIPDSFKGKLHRIILDLHPEFFDMLPGYNDPTPEDYRKEMHDYTLSIPEIVFGIPYQSKSLYAGNVYWTSGHGKNVELVHRVDALHTPAAACLVDNSTLEQLSELTGRPEELMKSLKDFWEGVASTCQKVPFTVEADQNTAFNLVKFDLSGFGTQFPFPRPSGEEGPEIADIRILLYTHADQLQPGRLTVSDHTKVRFEDDIGKVKQDEEPIPSTVTVVGPLLRIDIAGMLYDSDMVLLPNQTALNEDDKGYCRLNVTVANVGNGVAYHTDIIFFVPNTLSVSDAGSHQYQTSDISDTPFSSVVLQTDQTLVPGEPFQATLLVRFKGVKEPDRQGDDRLFLNASAGRFDLTADRGQFSVTQGLNEQFVVPLVGGGGWSAGVWFAVIGLPILAVLAGLLVLGALLYRHKKRQDETVSMTEVKSGKGAGKPASFTDETKVKHRVASAHYIMSGAKGVHISDGNPTALDVEAMEEEAKQKRGVMGFLRKLFFCR